MNTRKLITILLFVIGGWSAVYAQDAAVAYKKLGSNPYIIDDSAALEVESTKRGFLPPRMTTEERDIIHPASGLVIYNTTNNTLEINTGTPTDPSWKAATVSPKKIYIKNASYPMTATDDTILCDLTAGPFTLTLPPQEKGKVCVIGKIDDTANMLTFSPNLKLTTGTTVSDLNYARVIKVQSDGTDWYIVN